MILSILKPVIKCGAIALTGLLVLALALNTLVIPTNANPEMPHALRTIGVGVPLVCLIIGPVGYYISKDIRTLKYTMPVALVIPWIVFVVSMLLLLGITVSIFYVVIPSLAAIFFVIDVLTGKVSGRPWFRKRPIENLMEEGPRVSPTTRYSNQGEILVGAFEIVENPEDRVLRKDSQEFQRVWEPFENILRSMMGANAPLLYRLERHYGTTREYFLTLAKGNLSLMRNMDMLGRVLLANIPTYRVQRQKEFRPLPIDSSDVGVVACLTGEPLALDNPRQRGDPLTVVAEALLRQRNGVLQVSATPVSFGVLRSLKRMWLGRKYRAKASQAQVTITREKFGFLSRGTQESAMYSDMVAAEKVDKILREHQRYSAQHACQVEVSVASWALDVVDAERDAKILMHILQGTLTPADQTIGFKVHVKRDKTKLQRVLEGKPAGESTLLRPEEAALLFTLPQTDIGTPTSKRSDFSTATSPFPEQRETLTSSEEQQPTHDIPTGRRYVKWKQEYGGPVSFMILGNPLRSNGMTIPSIVWFPMQKFESHFGVYGNTRSGKTWTALMLVAQAIRNGLKTTILVPRKGRAWTRLLHLFPNIWVFTAGDPTTTPLRINMFSPPKNVPVSTWMKILSKILSGLLPNDQVMEMHFNKIIYKVYRDCGWDAESNVEGRPILLSDLWDAVEDTACTLPYGDELKANFYGALISRMESIVRNHTLVDMYNTEEGITWEDLAENNVIIDMEKLVDKDDSAFLMSLLTGGIHTYKMFNSSKRITNLLVLEEASYILKKAQGQNFYGPDAGETVLSLMVDMFTTCGENGLGTLTIEQLPGRLADEIVKLIVNVITHAIGDKPERKLVAGHIGVDEDRENHLQQMGNGETIVYLEGEGVPKSVKIWPVDRMLELELPAGGISSKLIKQHMEPIYQSNERLRSIVRLPAEIVERIQSVQSADTMTGDKVTTHHQEIVRSEMKEPSEYQEQVDSKIREYARHPRYVKNLARRVELAKEGDVLPLAKMIITLADELDVPSLSRKWVAGRLLLHSAEFYPTLVDPDLTDMVLIVIRGIKI